MGTGGIGVGESPCKSHRCLTALLYAWNHCNITGQLESKNLKNVFKNTVKKEEGSLLVLIKSYQFYASQFSFLLSDADSQDVFGLLCVS